ncbi:hypothetical protein VTN31DRAFT_4843 [Thermomyces dupontii]|uniref:uncharacterized protein n=1 Tax=Talaromyces thermophilus TaxID=28565 RepID=UPI003743664D
MRTSDRGKVAFSGRKALPSHFACPSLSSSRSRAFSSGLAHCQPNCHCPPSNAHAPGKHLVTGRRSMWLYEELGEHSRVWTVGRGPALIARSEVTM